MTSLSAAQPCWINRVLRVLDYAVYSAFESTLNSPMVSYRIVLPHQGSALWDEPTATMETAAAGPKLWNSLPADRLQDDISFQRFKRLL